MKNRVVLVCVIAGTVVALAAVTRVARVESMNHYLANQTYEDLYYLPPAEWLPVFSLGHRAALADLIWMKALVYFGEEFGHRGHVRHAFRYGDAMLALDPDFKAVYHWVAMAGMYRPVDVTVDDIRQSIAFLERGVERFPEDGKMNWNLGASLLFELAPLLDDEEAEEVKTRATPYVAKAVETGHAPAWMAFQSAESFIAIGQMEQAARHLEQVYAITQDEDLRARMLVYLGQLRAQQQALIDAAEDDSDSSE